MQTQSRDIRAPYLRFIRKQPLSSSISCKIHHQALWKFCIQVSLPFKDLRLPLIRAPYLIHTLALSNPKPLSLTRVRAEGLIFLKFSILPDVLFISLSLDFVKYPKYTTLACAKQPFDLHVVWSCIYVGKASCIFSYMPYNLKSVR